MKKHLITVFIYGILLQSSLYPQFGQALLFDGTTGYVAANSVSYNLNSPPNMTMEAWCYITNSVSYPIIMAFNTTSGISSNRNMIEYAGGKFDYYDDPTGSQFSSASSMNAWHHVAVVLSSDATNNGKFYVDGVLQSTFTTAVRPDSDPVTGEFSIGQEWDGGGPSQLFTGYIDEVRIWNVALTQAEIQANMSHEIPTNSTGLVAYYQMTDGIGTSLTDNTGHGNTGTLVGGVTFATPATPLPVELTSFSANTKSSSVELIWKTATETNNYGFEVERKARPNPSQGEGLADWQIVGFVKGNGNSNSPKDYSFVDGDVTSNRNYSYRLKQIDIDGHFKYSEEVEVSFASPKNYELSQNYPNPFNPKTIINYNLPKNSFVTLKVCDALGREVTTLVNEEKTAGTYSVAFDASQLSSGVYFYRLQADEFIQIKKMVLVK